MQRSGQTKNLHLFYIAFGHQSLAHDLSMMYLLIVFLPVYFSAAKGFAGGLEKYKTKVVIRSNGTITWFAATQFTSSCKQNIRFFPYDEQFCYLKFG